MILLITFFVGSLNAQTYISGNDLYTYMVQWEKWDAGIRDKNNADPISVGYFGGYIAGVYDAIHNYYVLPEGVPLKQLCKIGARFLKNHPELLHYVASELIDVALVEAFPLPDMKQD